MEVSSTKTYLLESGCGNLYVTISHENYKPTAVFLQNRSGCVSSIQMIGILISQQLQDGKSIDDIVKTLRKGSPCDSCSNLANRTKSCATLIASALCEFKEEYMGKETQATVEKLPEESSVKQSSNWSLKLPSDFSLPSFV